MAGNGNQAPGEILVRHLNNFTVLRCDERAAVMAVAARPVLIAGARRDLIRQGDRPRGVILILSGWAYRYKMLEDGRRQILAFLLPGDMCDLHNAVLAHMDHSIGAITSVRYVEISSHVLHRLSFEHPRVGRALWWQMLVNVATQREWTTNIGQRGADKRIGSLFCELILRLRAVGLMNADSIDFPLTQIDLADATGLTAVHVNRMVQQLRGSGLIAWVGKSLTIPDLARLQKASVFDADYLHLGGNGESNHQADGTGGE